MVHRSITMQHATPHSMPSLELAPCPVCGTDAHDVVANADDIRHEVELLWEFHTLRLRPATPPERLADRVAFSQHPPLNVVRCTRCGLVYRNPRERAFELRDTYEHDSPDRAVLESLFHNQRRSFRTQARRLTRALGRTGRGVEIGSYVGAFLDAARAEGWTFEGLDINSCLVSFARRHGLRATLGDITSLDDTTRYDAVAIWNTFEQLPDPRDVVRRAHGALRDGGVLALRVPNGDFYAALRRHLDGPVSKIARELLAQNNLLTFPYRHGFTPGSLRTLLERAGFTIVSMTGTPLVPTSDEWTRPWATVEERVVKSILRPLGRLGLMPWIEVLASREQKADSRKR
jgi:2-polyprenyl-3-methyl-5-hydroxy-6-metoxy-1,4-benzoquinol methylase